jgi:hypothetical protein
MVLRGNIGIGRYWFGVLPLYVGHLFKAGITRNPNIFYVGPLLVLSILNKENILVEMREEAFMWPK